MSATEVLIIQRLHLLTTFILYWPCICSVTATYPVLPGMGLKNESNEFCSGH